VVTNTNRAMKTATFEETREFTLPKLPLSDAIRPAVWVLRFTIFIQAIGLLQKELAGGSIVTSHLFMTWNVSEAASLSIDFMGSCLTLLAATTLLIHPTRTAACVVATWVSTHAILSMIEGGNPFTNWALLAHATRIAAPCTLFLLIDTTHPLNQRIDRATKMLRYATATTFIMHGVEAISHHPRFVDYIIHAANQLIQLPITQSQANHLLYGIGGLDILVAILILSKPKLLWPLAYMALWGLITAASRIIHSGSIGISDAFIRAANAGVPLCLFLLLYTDRTNRCRGSIK